MRLRPTLVMAVMLARPALAPAQSPASGFARIDSLMSAFAARAKVPGIAYGDRRRRQGRPHRRRPASATSGPARRVDTNTVFRIASMTKSFTALSILQAARRRAGSRSTIPPSGTCPSCKALRVSDDRLAEDHHPAPALPLGRIPRGQPVGRPAARRRRHEQMSAMIRSGIPFSTSPGTAYEYSNFGFAILGRIVANVSGMPYTRYVRTPHPPAARHDVDDAGGARRARQPPRARLPVCRTASGSRSRSSPTARSAPWAGCSPRSPTSAWVGFMLDAWPARDGAERGPVKRSSVREMQQVSRFNGATARRATRPRSTIVAQRRRLRLRARRPPDLCASRPSCRTAAACRGSAPSCAGSRRYGVGIVALGNLTYTGWGGAHVSRRSSCSRSDRAPREPAPAPILLSSAARRRRG